MKKFFTMQGSVNGELPTMHANNCGCAACKLSEQDEPLQLNSGGRQKGQKVRDTSGPLGLGRGALGARQ